MITLYLLKNCPFCKDIDTHIKEYPSINICVIYVAHMNHKGLNRFPCAVNSLPNNNGLPKDTSKKLYGSKDIMKFLKDNTKKNNFGNEVIKGNEIEVHTNTSTLDNINVKMNSCFNGNCNTRMDRPYGPCDNKYLLDKSQPRDALPIRTNIPIADFGKRKSKRKSKSKRKTKSKTKSKTKRITKSKTKKKTKRITKSKTKKKTKRITKSKIKPQKIN